MKRDCPHCQKSMEGTFLQWHQFARQDRSRACPICGKGIRLRTYPEEILVRVLAAALLIGGAYLARERGGHYATILIAVVISLAVAFGAVHLRLRERQRFTKG